MIDETKLIEKIKARKEYLQQQAAECDEAGDTKHMDIWDAKKLVKKTQQITNDLDSFKEESGRNLGRRLSYSEFPNN